MLVLRRKEGQWVTVTCNCGCNKSMNIRLYKITGEQPGRANLAFDDDDMNFIINRPERPRQTED